MILAGKALRRREAGVDVNGHGVVGVDSVTAAQQCRHGNRTFFALTQDQLVTPLESLNGELQNS